MDLKINWTDSAKTALYNIFTYYKINVGLTIAQNIIINIVKSTDILAYHPQIGTKEPLLQDRKQEFRFLIHKNYKIIYWHNKKQNRIDIADVFDTRQNPIKIQNIRN